MVLVHFDLEEGQVEKYFHPQNQLSEVELRDICKTSFPDTYSSRGVSKYCFSFII